MNHIFDQTLSCSSQRNLTFTEIRTCETDGINAMAKLHLRLFCKKHSAARGWIRSWKFWTALT